ncbi:hypothetical protein TWF481_009962 [Arthrobotrys musiformis]|uniref:Uncharacterized protein n=1 Tax=Arthrobotrys musiformis TaxID=47236 RepID=A0AAV9VZG8_9PEZI
MENVPNTSNEEAPLVPNPEDGNEYDSDDIQGGRSQSSIGVSVILRTRSRSSIGVDYPNQATADTRRIPRNRSQDSFARESDSIFDGADYGGNDFTGANPNQEPRQSLSTDIMPGRYRDEDISGSLRYQSSSERSIDSRSASHGMSTEIITNDGKLFHEEPRREADNLTNLPTVLQAVQEFHGNLPGSFDEPQRYDSSGRRYPEALVEKILTAPTAGQTTAELAEDDETFGSTGSILYFSRSKDKKGITEIPNTAFSGSVYEMTIGESAFFNEEDGRPHCKKWGLRWVHLPTNNLKWVYPVIINILKKRSQRNDIIRPAKDAAKQILGRFGSGTRRGAAASTPPHGRHIRPSCHRIPVNQQIRSKGLHNSKRNLSLAIPFLHCERSIDRFHMAKIISDCTKLSTYGNETKPHLPNVREISQLPCTDDEKLLRYFPPGKTSFQMRRTLDQANFPTLDTKERDMDQVVERYAEKHLEGEARIIMVDQLWLWVFGNHTVLTCFPRAWRRHKDETDPADVFTALRDYLKKRDKTAQIGNVGELAACIADRCAANIFDSQLMYDEHFDFMEIFRRSIAVVMDEQSKLFAKISDETEIGTDFFKEEFRLLREIKDIRDELQIMRSIHLDQNRCLADMRSALKIRENYTKFNPESVTGDLDSIIRSADAAYDALIHLLDIKQKQAAFFVASQAKETGVQTNEILTRSGEILEQSKTTTDQLVEILKQSKTTVDQLVEISDESRITTEKLVNLSLESKRGGDIILIFTMVTIFFAPISTIASLFSVNAIELNDGKLPLKTVFGIVFPISVLFCAAAFAVVANRDSAQKRAQIVAQNEARIQAQARAQAGAV